MSEPTIPAKVPAVMNLEPGDYYWCTCGQSASQPFCNGAHAGTDFTPMKFTIESEQKVALCQCKHTKNPPYCDGAHAAL